MKKIVINNCHGGFGLSHEAVLRYFEIKGQPVWPEQHPGYSKYWRYWIVSPEDRMDVKEAEDFYELSMDERQAYNKKYSEQTIEPRNIVRDDPALVQVVEEMGKAANGDHAAVKVVEIPDDVKWVIEEYDGAEWVAEKHRTWS